MTERIVLVGSLPPSNLGLNEYNHHIAKSFAEHKSAELVVLANKIGKGESEGQYPENVTVIRCWSYNQLRTIPVVLWHILRLKPNAVWYNLIFTSFADRRVHVFLTMLLPLLTRLMGVFTISTLHHLFEFIEQKDSKYRSFGVIDDLAAQIVTRSILASHAVFLPLQKYVDTLRTKYRAVNAFKMSHGFFAHQNLPSVQARKRILLFGKFGSYKRVEPAIEIFKKLQRSHPEVELVIGGGDHPAYPGYLASVQKKYAELAGLTFTGYVPEADLPQMFRESSVVLMPYTSSTGVSGVAHIACSFGLAIVASKLPDFEEMASETGMQIDAYDPDDEDGAATVLDLLFRDFIARRARGMKNFSVSQTQSISSVVSQYLGFIRSPAPEGGFSELAA